MRLLDIENVPDWPNALNGLQLANRGTVTSIGAAVDAGEATLEKAAVGGRRSAPRSSRPLLGRSSAAHRRRIIARSPSPSGRTWPIYSAHLPLDVHPTLGNNALLARSLGLRRGPSPSSSRKAGSLA